MSFAFFGKSLVALLAMGGVAGGFYETSKVKVFNSKENFFLPKDLEEASPWRVAQSKLRNTERYEKNTLSKPFRDLREQLHKPDAPSNTAGERIKKLCLEVYDMNFKTFFYFDNELENDAERFCSLTFREMMEEEKVLIDEYSTDEDDDSEDGKEEWEKLHTELTKYIGPTLFDPKPELDKELKEAKEESTDGWKKLKAWCKKAYDKKYQKSTDDAWRLAYEFCRKPPEPADDSSSTGGDTGSS